MGEILVTFDRVTQSVDALREAAYRLIDLASCTIEAVDNRYVCRLEPKGGSTTRALGEDGLRLRFIDLVTDENIREKVSAETVGLRDVILALAFGAWAKPDADTPGR